jgi:tetratricopeptide (TPR) repeat protein
MLRDIDPNLRGQGRPFTAEDVLGFARDRLAADLSVATDVRAELLAVLGEGYSGVGDPAAAVPVLDKAVDQATAAWGAEATQTLDARVHRVLAMQYVNRGEEALAEIAGIIEILARTGRLNSPVHAAALEARVEVLLNGGKAITDEAEAAGLEALAVAERAGSGNEPSVAQAHRSLAVIFRTRSKHEQAIEHAALGYRLTGDLRGHDPWHPQVILAQNEYGRCLFQAGRTADSVAELQSAADYGQRTFRDNPIVLQHLLGTLANVQLAYGDLKGGIANLDASARLDMRGITLSPVYVASQHVVRARAFLAARQLDDAVTEFDRALAIAATTPDVNLVATLQTERAEALVRLGRDEEARRALDRIATGRGPNPSPAARRAVWLLGEIERRQGHDRDALALFREAASGPAATGRSKIDKGFFQLSMGFSLLALGEPEEARPVLDEARAALSAGAGKTTPAVANALVALGRAHLATGDNAAALPLLTEADLFWRDFAPRSTDAADAARWLAAARTSRLLTR